MRYRISIDLEARDAQEARALLSTENWFQSARRMKIENRDVRRTICYALFVGFAIAFWVAAIARCAQWWRMLP